MFSGLLNLNHHKNVIAATFLLSLIILGPPPPPRIMPPAPIRGVPTDPNLKIAFIGDTAYGANFRNVLNLIEAEGAHAVIHLGDFDYVYDADGFWSVIDQELGANYPYFLAVGNHDIDTWHTTCTDPDGCYATFAINRMQALGITPDDWNLNDQTYSITYRGLKIAFGGQTTSLGDSVYAPYLDSQLASDNHIWRICAWHKNQQAMQVGTKPNEAGWGVYEACRQRGAIIATSHEHSYSRTRTLTDFPSQLVDPIWNQANALRVTSGSTFAFVSGLGGHSIRSQSRCLPTTFPYGCNGEWASIYSSTQSATYGALFITFNVNSSPYQASGYFKTISGQTIDQFNITAQPRWVPIEALLDQPFNMLEGEQATLNGSAVQITFTDIIEDSRCPTRAECAQPGQVTARFNVTTSSGTTPVDLTITEQGSVPITVDGYTISLSVVRPAPSQTAPVEYTATLTVQAP